MTNISPPKSEEAKISVIIPVYEVEDYIEECLQSLLAQTYRNVEILLVDDLGKDNSIAKAVSFLEQSGTPFSWKVITHEKNKGPAASRNSGIKAATGEYLFFIDADDKVTPNCFELLHDAIIKEDADFSIAGFVLLYSDGTVPCPWTFYDLCYTGTDVLKLYLERKWYQTPWNKLLRRDFIIDNNLFYREGWYYEDELWTFRLACTAKKMAAIQDNLYFYRQRDKSIMSDYAPLTRFSTLPEIYSETWRIAKEKGLLSDPLFLEWFQYKMLLFFKNIRTISQLSRFGKWMYYARSFARFPREFFVLLSKNVPEKSSMLQRIGYMLTRLRPQALGYLFYIALVERNGSTDQSELP